MLFRSPAATGSGSIKYEESAALTMVTWDGVYNFGGTTAADANTLQFQFYPTGQVVIVFSSISANGNGFLVGVAGAAPNTDLGSRDISVTLPGGFRTQPDNSVPLALAGTLPQLGTTCVLTTTQFPSTSALGLQILSTTQINPGVDLTVIGMPGCFQLVGLDVMYALFPVAGSATYNLVVPNNPALMGATLGSQSAAFYAGANPFGVITSNGVGLTLGV